MKAVLAVLALSLPGAVVAEEPGYTRLSGFIVQVEGCFEGKSAPVCIEALRYRCARAVIEGRVPEGAFLKPDQCTGEILKEVQVFDARERLSRLTWAGTFVEGRPGLGGQDALDLMVGADAAWTKYAKAECRALSAGYTYGTARGGYNEICLLRLTVERIQHMRRFHPDGLTRDDFDKE